jgi:hypothetical protein
MKKKTFLLKAALAAITIWGGLSCSTNGYSLAGQFWQFNLKQIDKGY